MTFANERTFLAWIRTALALVGGGIAAGAALDITPRWLHVLVAVTPTALGLAIAVLGYRRWSDNDRALRAGQGLPVDAVLLKMVVAIAVIAVAVAVGTVAVILTRS